MVRGLFIVLLCCAFLFSIAPIGQADGGAPNSNSSSNSSNSNNSGTNSSGSSTQVVANPFLFIDVPADHWAVEDLKYLVEYGVITGLPNGAFNGDSYLTRYSASAMVARAMRLMMNSPEQLTTDDLNALQQLLFEVSEQVETNRVDIETLANTGVSSGGNEGSVIVETDPSIELRLNQLANNMEQLQSDNIALREELNQLKQAPDTPQPNIAQLNQLRQQANANFILAVSAMFVGIIGVGVAIMT